MYHYLKTRNSFVKTTKLTIESIPYNADWSRCVQYLPSSNLRLSFLSSTLSTYQELPLLEYKYSHLESKQVLERLRPLI